MDIKTFLNEISGIITNFEISKTFERDIRIVDKILTKFKTSFTTAREKTYIPFIKELKTRLSKIEPCDKAFLIKMAELREYKDILEYLGEIKE